MDQKKIASAIAAGHDIRFKGTVTVDGVSEPFDITISERDPESFWRSLTVRLDYFLRRAGFPL